MTVREHYILTMKLMGMMETKENIEAITSLVGLNHQLDVFIRNLSPGSKRKLTIGLALIGKPRFLILDEPTANLDLKSREKIWKLISSLIDNPKLKLGILVST